MKFNFNDIENIINFLKKLPKKEQQKVVSGCCGNHTNGSGCSCCGCNNQQQTVDIDITKVLTYALLGAAAVAGTAWLIKKYLDYKATENEGVEGIPTEDQNILSNLKDADTFNSYIDRIANDPLQLEDLSNVITEYNLFDKVSDITKDLQGDTDLETGVIPNVMPAGSIILFDQNNKPIIIKQGVGDLPVDEAEVVVGEGEDAMIVEDFIPEPGTIVTYDEDGVISDIINPAEVNEIEVQE